MSYRREDIKNAIWDDEDFDALSNDAALLYLWSFTNPRCGMAGVYRIKRRHLCEGRLSGDDLEAALDELARSGHLHYVDGYVWVRTRVKHLRTKGEPMMKSIVKDVSSLPKGHPFCEAFLTEYEPQWAELGVALREVLEPKKLEPPTNPSGGSEGVHSNGLDKPDSDEDRLDKRDSEDLAPQAGLSEPPEGLRGRGRGIGRSSGPIVDEDGLEF